MKFEFCLVAVHNGNKLLDECGFKTPDDAERLLPKAVSMMMEKGVTSDGFIEVRQLFEDGEFDSYENWYPDDIYPYGLEGERRACSMAELMGVWNNIYNLHANYQDLDDEEIEKLRNTMEERVNKALEGLNNACNISDEDVQEWLPD